MHFVPFRDVVVVVVVVVVVAVIVLSQRSSQLGQFLQELAAVLFKLYNLLLHVLCVLLHVSSALPGAVCLLVLIEQSLHSFFRVNELFRQSFILSSLFFNVTLNHFVTLPLRLYSSKCFPNELLLFLQ